MFYICIQSDLLSVLFDSNFCFILSIPATSFGRSQLQPIFPLLEALPEELQVAVPYLLSGIMGNSWVDKIIEILYIEYTEYFK